MDNTAKENKNRILLAFFAYLVTHKYLNEVIISFDDPGHTHNEIDQQNVAPQQRYKLKGKNIIKYINFS